MATDKPRYSITVDDDLFEKIEEFRFSNRYQTRSQATVELIRLGLLYLQEHQFANSEYRVIKNISTTIEQEESNEHS